MTAADRAPAFPLGTLPPIRMDDDAHPLLDRRQVNVRWLAATALLTCGSAAFMWLVLHAALSGTSRPLPPERPAVSAMDRMHVSGARSDRLVLHPTMQTPRGTAIHVQALQSTGLGDNPLTVLVADLAHVDSEPATPAVALTGGVADRENHDHSVPPTVPLPSIITAGVEGFHAILPGQASSYAAAEKDPTAEPGPRGTPLNVTAIPRGSASAPDQVELAIAQRGDGVDRVLARFGFARDEIGDLATALLAPPEREASLSGGERFELRHAAAATKPYMVTLRRPDGSSAVAALTDAGRYRSIDAGQATDSDDDAGPDLTASANDADDGSDDAGSLREAVSNLDGHDGIDQGLAASIVRVLGAGLDLGRGVAASDKLEALYGPFGETGERQVLFAALEGRGKTTRFYRYTAPDDGSVDYYDESGHSIMKFLLRKPVANGQLGDGFGWRIHPVLHDRRFHEGVDYRAPYGSPIVAAGAGAVEKIGWERGYGLYLRVRHDLGYETTYAHLSSTARGMAVGRRVQQGETVAYVGSTGYSTGPHLYYEVRINGRNVDPLSVKLAAGRLLQGATLADFERRRDRIDTLVKASASEAKG